VNLKQAIEQSYNELSQTQFEKYEGFRKTISLIVQVENKFNNSRHIQLYKDIESMGVIFSDQNNGNSLSLNCFGAPDYDNKFALIQWTFEEFRKVESYFDLEFFRTVPKNPVQGKRI